MANASGSSLDNRASTMEVRAIGSGTSAGYTLEARVPWSSLARNEVVAGMQLGMNLYVREGTATGPRVGSLQTMMSNNPAAALSAKSATWRDQWSTLTLMP